MGVKGLWTLLGPYSDQKSLYEIRGQKVAIDLSGWICDSQNAANPHTQPKLYLRNLFFRTTYLLIEDITPIFVLEGKAPSAKQDVMANRNMIQFGTSKRLKKPDRNRKHFASVVSYCEKLLKSMGIECVQGNGEAEAMCAHLNRTGTVNAVISQDSDCFVYGAIRVYRNFSISNSGANSASSGSVDVYDINEIKKSLDFGRKKMVALAILCGSDYNGNGVDGVGYANAIGFLSQISEDLILDRFRSWNNRKLSDLSQALDMTNRCSGCGHDGNIRTHNKNGCFKCKTTIGCNQSTFKDHQNKMKTELNICKKALQTPEFPYEDLINEYLIAKEETPENFRPRWKKPDLIKFVNLMNRSLGWDERYCVEKFLPLLTRWQLLQHCKDKRDNISLHFNDKYSNDVIKPACIKKKRNPKGIPCYEVIWEDTHDYYEGLIPDDQIKDDLQEIWTTVERQDLMESAYPEVVERFLESKKKKTKTAKSKKDVIDICADITNLSIDDEPKKRRKRKNEATFKTKPRKYKRKVNDSQRRLDSFVRTNLDTTCALMNRINDEELIDDDSDMSAIIDGILSRDNRKDVEEYLANNLTPIKLGEKPDCCSTPIVNRRTSYFFGLNVDDDVFETSVDLKSAAELETKASRRSSFHYTPLIERIKKLKDNPCY